METNNFLKNTRKENWRQACEKMKRIHFSSFLAFFLPSFFWQKFFLGAVAIKNKK
jgi:hypothetical protein